ncbi:AAA family ATPase [Microbacterium lacticum]|uniref:AAA family ATPase n=1 Tax=Microbacterium lacticum TaxID=33885 RepID=UPI00242E137A|nr:AAA family ATPase [Microbacterium lacticum]
MRAAGGRRCARARVRAGGGRPRPRGAHRADTGGRLRPGAVGGAGAAQLHEAIALLLEAASRERPVVVVSEDLHWIDGASLAAAQFSMRALTAGRLLFVLTYRGEDIGPRHPARPFLIEAERHRAAERWDLGPLTRGEVRRQMHQLIGEAPAATDVDAVFERSDGIPFFVEELVAIDACRRDSAIPETLRELLLARYERLSDDARCSASSMMSASRRR